MPYLATRHKTPPPPLNLAPCRTQALWALSCLIRNFPPAEGAFVSADGVLVLCRGAREEDDRVKTKARLVWSLPIA